MTKASAVNKLKKEIPNLPYKDNIKSLALFGSFLHGNNAKGSDLDIIIELKKPLGYFGLAQIERAIENVVNCPVDLVTSGAISKYFRKLVLQEAEIIYES